MYNLFNLIFVIVRELEKYYSKCKLIENETRSNVWETFNLVECDLNRFDFCLH